MPSKALSLHHSKWLLVLPVTELYAGENVNLSGFGKMDGRYQIGKVLHQVGTGDYSLQISGWRLPEEAADWARTTPPIASRIPKPWTMRTKSWFSLCALFRTIAGRRDTSFGTEIMAWGVPPMPEIREDS